MKFKGTLIDGASGRLAGNVFSHNRGGPYVRALNIPINPPTAPQTAARAYMTNSVYLWTQTLTTEQRQAWNDYAGANPVLDGQGNSINIGGLGMFNRINIIRLTAGLAAQLDAPTVSGPAYLTPPTITLSGSDLSVVFNDTDVWNQDTGGLLQVQVTRAVSPTRYSAAGIPLQIAGFILGDSGSPPTSPASIPYQFSPGAGQRVFYICKASDANGRVSAAVAGNFLCP